MTLTIRNAEIEGRPDLDARLSDGRIEAIGPGLVPAGEVIDAAGGALIPGLIDHHIHLMATAARAGSVDLEGAASPAETVARLRAGLEGLTPGAWLRAVGFHDFGQDPPDRRDLDRIAPDHPLRVQHRTGALWILNSRAIDLVMDADAPAALERDADGAPTGRLWRGDAWLQDRIGRTAPDLARLGADLAALGVTGVTDASAGTDASAAAVLADAVRSGALPQRLCLMSAGPLEAPADGAFRVGPVKILLDDRDLPPPNEIEGRIAAARAAGRAVAVHCVTAAELAVTLAAFEAAGARPGDRIEHGGVIPAPAMGQIASLGLTVVTQPAFVRSRGDRWLAEVDPAEQPDLWRAATLVAAGIPLAAGSDAPYGPTDPWLAIAAAMDRRTGTGRDLGPAERLDPAAALGLYFGPFEAPGGPARRVVVGAAADLCLLRRPLAPALAAPAADLVAATLVGGVCVWRREV